MAMLLLARAFGAGTYGIGAVPFLFGLFVASGVIAGRAAGALVRRAWSPAGAIVGAAIGMGAFVVAGALWNATPSDRPLLVREYGLTTAVAAAWALASTRTARRGARVTAAVSAAFLLVAAAGGL